MNMYIYMCLLYVCMHACMEFEWRQKTEADSGSQLQEFTHFRL